MIYKSYFTKQLEWVIGFFCLGIIAFMVYLLITGAFLSVPLPFLSGWTETTRYSLFEYSTNTYYETCEMAFNMEDYYNTTHLYDFALNDNHGNETGLADTSGYFGRALEDYASGWIEYPDLAITGQSYTIMIWIYPTSTVSQRYIITGDHSSERIKINAGNLSIIMQGSDYLYTNQTIQTNDWQHLTVVYDYALDDGLVYINGTCVWHDSSMSGTQAWNGVGTIGRREDKSGSYTFIGKLDEVRIYKGEARTQTEIQQDMVTPMQMQLGINGLSNGDVTQLWYNSTNLFEQQDASSGETNYNVWNFSGGVTPYSGIVHVFHEEMNYESPVMQLNFGDVYTYSVQQRVTLNDIGLFMALLIIFGVPFILIPVVIIIKRAIH